MGISRLELLVQGESYQNVGDSSFNLEDRQSWSTNSVTSHSLLNQFLFHVDSPENLNKRKSPDESELGFHGKIFRKEESNSSLGSTVKVRENWGNTCAQSECSQLVSELLSGVVNQDISVSVPPFVVEETTGTLYFEILEVNMTDSLPVLAVTNETYRVSSGNK